MATDAIRLSRRRLLGVAAGAATLSQFTGCQSLSSFKNSSAPPISAAQLPDGQYSLSTLNIAPGHKDVVPPLVDNRCHGGCRSPLNTDVVVFERRPGWHFYILDDANHRIKHRITASEGEHFYGHGTYSKDGTRLYATANRYGTGEGLIVVYDSSADYRRLDTFELPGIGPHEIRLHPDGQTLLVALGGIETHPDYGRMKLNLPTMDPALLMVDRHTGTLKARFRPSHHQLSCRHLDVSPDGTVWVGYQFQGAEHETPPQIGCYRKGAFQEPALPEHLLLRLRNYIASVAVCASTGMVGVTAPRGGLALFLEGNTQQVLHTASIPDCAGIKAQRNGSFIVTSGTGGIYSVAPKLGNKAQLAHPEIAWDNHLI